MKLDDSERLSFRLLDARNEQDNAQIHQPDQDPKVMKYINGGRASTPQEQQRVRTRLAQFTRKDRAWGLWGAFEKQERRFLGWILVRPISFFTDEPQWNNLEVGWRFASSCWGRGYATEAAFAVLHALALLPDIEYFSAFAARENMASIRVIHKIGMQPHAPVPTMEAGYSEGADYFRMRADELR